MRAAGMARVLSYRVDADAETKLSIFSWTALSAPSRVVYDGQQISFRGM